LKNTLGSLKDELFADDDWDDWDQGGRADPWASPARPGWGDRGGWRTEDRSEDRDRPERLRPERYSVERYSAQRDQPQNYPSERYQPPRDLSGFDQPERAFTERSQPTGRFAAEGDQALAAEPRRRDRPQPDRRDRWESEAKRPLGESRDAVDWAAGQLDDPWADL
jgi:molecular chaperone DnaK